MMYKVEVRIPDSVLVELTATEFITFRDIKVPWVLLGFEHPTSVRMWCDYPHCDKVFSIETEEVVKPSLFGHALPYTAEAL